MNFLCIPFTCPVLQGVSISTLRARLSLIKYMNRLVTPLLHYVDVSSFEAESALEADEIAAVSSTRRYRSCHISLIHCAIWCWHSQSRAEKKAAALAAAAQGTLQISAVVSAESAAPAPEVKEPLLLADQRSLSYVVHQLKVGTAFLHLPTAATFLRHDRE